MKPLFFYIFLTLPFSFSGFAQTITAKQLYDEHRKNSSAFENKYRNQKITVSGKIRSIVPVSYYWQGASNYHKINLTATGYENYIVCQIPYEDSALLKSFKAGDVITVSGIVAPVIVDALYLNDCKFNTAKPVVVKKAAPQNAPLGKYNVYQNDAAGFSYQYTLQLNSYNTYTLNGKAGTCIYTAKTKTFKFTSGPLKGFAGIYRPFTDNDQDPPTIVLDAKGNIPDLKSAYRGYQYGYYQTR